MGSKTKKVLAIITLLTFVIVTFLVYSNLHFHIVDSSYVIHGHPYHKKPHDAANLPNHTHSTSGFLYYSSIFNIVSLVILLLIVFVLVFTNEIVFKKKNFYYLAPLFSTPFLRAPPVTA